MNNSPKRFGSPLAAVVVMLACGAFAAWLLSERSRHAATLAELQREAADLRTQLEARDGTVESLQSEVRLLRDGAFPVGTSPASATELELTRRVADLALQQSNIAVVVAQLLEGASDTLGPVVSVQRTEPYYAALHEEAQDQQRRLIAAKTRVVELLLGLSVPAEVSTMDAAKALDTASLRPFWPYFEAKRARDSLSSIASQLQMREIQERIDDRARALSQTLPPNTP
jgi:hypothetical protein